MNTLERCSYENAGKMYQNNDTGRLMLIIAQNSLVTYLTDATNDDGKIWMIENNIFAERFTEINDSLKINNNAILI